jgi:hypothetical protein
MSRRTRYSEFEVRDAVLSSHSMSETLRMLGLRPAGGNFRTLKKLIAYCGISTEHFDPNWGVRLASKKAVQLEDVLVEKSTYDRGKLKRRLYAEGLKQRQCELCGQGEEWHGRQMSLILDHVNGVPTDNRLDNLRIVCPNCAATLDTHCGRQTRLDRAPRRCLHCGASFVPERTDRRYCSRYCGARHDRRRRDPKPETRKVPRPTYEQLIADIASMSFVAVGRKYGVSDNAVRKWLRWYESQYEREGGSDQGQRDAA